MPEPCRVLLLERWENGVHLRDLLQTHGFVVTLVTNQEEGIEAFRLALSSCTPFQFVVAASLTTVDRSSEPCSLDFISACRKMDGEVPIVAMSSIRHFREAMIRARADVECADKHMLAQRLLTLQSRQKAS